MTTALIGKQGALAAKARVAFVTRNGGSPLASAFHRTGHELLECPDWSSVATADATAPFDLILCDEGMLALLPAGITAPVLTMNDRQSSTSLTASALEATLEPMLSLAVALSQGAARCRELERVVDGIRSGTALVGRSPATRRLHSAVCRAADCDATVLIEGPAGSGKSLAARMIHAKSRRANRILTVIDCGTTVADALTKALEDARGTTLVLEDIDRLSAAAQALLVRHLKERPAGQGNAVPRLVTTTSAHLPEAVARGAFREALFYRRHALPIVVPGLRERIEDIQPIAQSIAEATSPASGTMQHFTPTALMLLESMPWPGNITQLEATIRRAQLMAGGGPIDREHLLASPEGNAAPATTPVRNGSADHEVSEDSILPFEQEEQQMLTRALRATKGNVRRAAQLLGIGRATLYRKIQQYRLRLQ